MPKSPKSNDSHGSTPTPALLESAWKTIFDVAGDARLELHKQVAGLIALVGGALAGGVRLVGVVNDRTSDLAAEALAATDGAARGLIAGTRETAKRSALRASETARALVGRAEAA